MNRSRRVAFVLLCASACTPTSSEGEVIGSTATKSSPESPAPPTSPAPPPPVGNHGEALMLTAAADFACALQRAGTVACWGIVPARLLGQDHDGRIEEAVLVQGLDDAVAIASVSHAGCAIRRNGSVVCWGSEDPKWEHKKTAGPLVEVADVRDATALHGGSGLMCAMTASGVWCWGHPTPEEHYETFAGIGEHRSFSDPRRFGPVRLTLEGIRGLHLGYYPAAYLDDDRVIVWKPGKPVAPKPHVPLGDYSTFDECLSEVGDDPELRRDCTAMLVADNEPPEIKFEPNPLTEIVEVYSDRWVECQVRSSGEVFCMKGLPLELVDLRGARKLVHDAEGRIMGVRPDGSLVGVVFNGPQDRLVIDDSDHVTDLVAGDRIFGIRHGQVYEWTSTPENPRYYKSRVITLPTPRTPK